MTPKIQGLDAVIMITPNFEAQVRFYRDVLGLEVQSLWSDGAFFKAGDQMFGIFASGHHPEAEARLGESEHGLSHFEFRIAAGDADAFRQRLTEAGHHAYRDNFQDADGNLFHFNLTEADHQDRSG